MKPGIKIQNCSVITASILFFVFSLLNSSCRPTRKLQAHQYLVDKVEIHNAKETNVSKESLEAFFRQRPNRKLFREFHFFVWWYNLFNDEKLRLKKIKRNIRYDRLNSEKAKRFEKKNARRAKKGKGRKNPKFKDKESPLLLESVRDVGEPPVVYDSLLTEQTRFQLQKYLFTKGYFNSQVKDTVQLIRSTKRAKVKYYLIPGKPFIVNRITYDMKDKELGEMVLKDTVNTLLQVGMQFDEEKFRAEQQRITDFALNNGYYYFENAYLNIKADSSQANHTVAIKIQLKKYTKSYNSSTDSIITVNHPRYKLTNVYIITEPSLGSPRDLYFKDTITTNRRKIKFLLNRPLAYKRRIIVSNTDLYPGQYYRKDTAMRTYKQLLGLGVFRNVNIQFFENSGLNNQLDCYIVCNPLIKQSITTETEGTNTSGNLGVDGSIVYQNRNLFKGGELIQLKLQASIAAQRNLTKDSTTTSGDGVKNVEQFRNTFNTIQFGPELSFSVPRALFPFSLFSFRKDKEPRTYIKTSFNYQTRQQFDRIIYDINYGFSFKTYNKQIRHDIIPFEAYAVWANLLPSFKSELLKLNDAFLLNSFQDHITTVSKYVISFTSKENTVSGKRTAYYARLNLQSSGNILREVYSLTGQPQDTAGRYRMFGIPFAQFLKTDLDVRIYMPVRKKSRVVYRFAGGIGKPLKNLGWLPYEQSFFSGGPNSVRAWRARTLGPGGYNPGENQARFDKIGDILLEGNIEYRFHMIRSFYGALFLDAGNVWRLYPDKSKPGGEFKLNTFADQIAIGGGLGIRWDLSFFVLRLDLGVPLKDPKLEEGKRWTFDKQPWQYTVANFGIGYPF